MITDEILETLKKVCSALSKHNVEYIVVGGAAVSYHGYSRASGITVGKPEIKVDLDFWYNPTAGNFYKLLDALDELNVDTSELKNIVFDPKRTFLKIPHDTFHTDFLPVMDGLDSFRESKKRAEVLNLDGNVLLMLSYDDLILNKKAVNREIDRSDIDELAIRRKGKQKGRGI